MGTPPAAWAFGEEDQDFSFEDQLAEEAGFEDEEERWAEYAAVQAALQGEERADRAERQEAAVDLPIDAVASQEAALGKCMCFQTLSLNMYP